MQGLEVLKFPSIHQTRQCGYSVPTEKPCLPYTLRCRYVELHHHVLLALQQTKQQPVDIPEGLTHKRKTPFPTNTAALLSTQIALPAHLDKR